MAEPAELQSGMLRGLNTQELDACQKLLQQISPDLDVDVAEIFDRVRAGKSLVQAMNLPDQTVDLLYAQALARFNAGDSHTAIPLFNALTLLAPQVRDHWLGLGICSRVLNKLPIAKLTFETAINISPQTAAPRFHLCEVLCQMKEWDGAKEQAAAFAQLPETPEKKSLSSEMKRLQTVIEVQSG